jgi:hypothetical protein
VTLAASVVLLLPRTATAQAKRHALESLDGLGLHNVAADTATLQGKRGVRLMLSDEMRQRLKSMTPKELAIARLEQLARLEGVEFSNGVIEVEIAGAPEPGVAEGARGFVGVAFRLQKDNETYDAFYLRPTNGRADDQERRNHTAQYMSHPDWPWYRLREETPAKYESYVDVVPGEWTRIKIEVRGNQARLYVHDNKQPTLIVNDVKSGARRKGAVALWLGPGTIAHFRNLTVDPSPNER